MGAATSGRGRASPIKSWMDPHIELYAPTRTFSYYRVVGYHPVTGLRVVNTSGGSTRRSADEKVRQVAEQLRAMAAAVPGMDGADPSRRLAHDEAQLWLRPENHRTRLNREWTTRHTENMRREWRLRISPHIPAGTPVAALRDKTLWVRILNDASNRGALSAESVQKTGQACRSFVSWLMDRGLLAANPMAGVRYSVSAIHNEGLAPHAVAEREVATFDQALDLGLALAWIAWRQPSGRGGERRADQVGTLGRGLQPLLVATSAIRSGELFALRADDIDVAGLEVRIREALIEGGLGRSLVQPAEERRAARDNPGGRARGRFRGVHRLAALQDRRVKPAAVHGTDGRPGVAQQPFPQVPHRRRTGRLARRAAVAGTAPPRRGHDVGRAPRRYGFTLEEVSKLMGHHSPEFTARRYLSLRSGWLERAKAAAAAFRNDPHAGFGDQHSNSPGIEVRM